MKDDIVYLEHIAESINMIETFVVKKDLPQLKRKILTLM